jgi:ABC-type uncharacterized transport system permease subunit
MMTFGIVGVAYGFAESIHHYPLSSWFGVTFYVALLGALAGSLLGLIAGSLRWLFRGERIDATEHGDGRT